MLNTDPADVVLKVDGNEVAHETVKRTVPAAFSASETFDVGVDLGSWSRSIISIGARSASMGRSKRLKSTSNKLVTNHSLECPLWVISGHVRRNKSCPPLYPQKRTCAVQLSMSALCQKQTFIGRLKCEQASTPPGPGVLSLLKILTLEPSA